MSDEQTPAKPATETITPAEEPKVDLSAEVAKGLEERTPAKAKEAMQELTQELTPEQLKQVHQLIESQTGSAVDGMKRKMEDEFSKRMIAGGYMKPDEVNALVEERLAFAEQKAEALRNLDRTLASMGVQPDSEEYRTVEKTYAKGLETGAFTVQTLLTEEGIKGVAYVAGVVGPEPKDPEPPAFLGGGSYTDIRPSEDYKRGDLDRQAFEKMMKGLQGGN